MITREAIQRLRQVLERIRSKGADSNDWNAAQIVQARSRVLPRYGPVFSPANIPSLDKETFLGFLEFDNNQHWSGLERHREQITQDMGRLRATLAFLVDESRPIRERLDRIDSYSGGLRIKWLGRAVLTAILQVVYPDRYGVLNGTAEAGMQQLGLWPDRLSQATLGEVYEAVNKILLELAKHLEIDLWTLDALWWHLTLRGRPHFDGGPTPVFPNTKLGEPDLSPGMQQHSEPRVRLPEEDLELPSSLQIAGAEDRLLAFFRKEYAYYDGVFYSDRNRVEPLDVMVTIAMNSYISKADQVRDIHRGLAEACDGILLLIPEDADLLTFDPELQVFERLMHAAVQVPGVLTAVATKVLHRKRRGFIPMLDNVVLKHYLSASGHPELLDSEAQNKQTAAKVAVRVARLFREDLRHARVEIASLHRKLAEAGFLLTPVRILEVLVWTETEPRGYYRTR